MTIDAAFKIQMDSEGPKVRSGAADPSGEFDVLLERVRARLGVMAAVLRLDGMATIVAHDKLVDTAQLLEATTFCELAMALGRPLVVPDATRDAGFAGDPTVIAAPHVRFFVGIPLFGPSGEAIGILALFDTVPRSQVAAKRLAGLAEDVTAGLGDGDKTATIARQKLALQAQRQVIREQAAMMSARSAAFDRASAAARIGMWECDLRTEKLDWSDGLYGIFDIPQGMYPDRRRTLACYTEPSRRTLEHLRGTAIAQQTGFQMDAEITSMLGRSRWIRLTATVESRFGKVIRIFGMKQDITEEKLLSDRTRYLAEFDVMTGLANRSQFQSRIAEWGTLHPDRAPIGALLLIDLDGFKQVNDNFGHELGDECLRQAATRLAEVCRGTELVARVGGDEFAVLVGTGMNRGEIAELAANIVKTLRISVHPRQSMTIGASVGIALSNDCAPADLFGKADMALYAAKAAGKNTYRMFGLDGHPV